jgi:NADH:ubiquinone oxidoreductase subunit H
VLRANSLHLCLQGFFFFFAQRAQVFVFSVAVLLVHKIYILFFFSSWFRSHWSRIRSSLAPDLGWPDFEAGSGSPL